MSQRSTSSRKYVTDADGKIWVRVVDAKFVATLFVPSGMKKDSEQRYRDYTAHGRNYLAISRMKNDLGKAGFAQATANKDRYSDNRVYLFYHQDFKPGADVSHIVRKESKKRPARKEFVPPVQALICD